MYKKLLIIIAFIGIFVACSSPVKNDKEIIQENITELEKQCYDDSTNTYNQKMALKTIVEYQKFIDQYPNDSTVANYLYLAGQLSKSINMYGEAIHKFDVLLKKFPNYEKAPNAQFLIGMIYENDIKDTLKAKLAYQKFIDKYPNNELTNDAELSIKYMSISPEDLIKIFEENNRKDSIN